MSSLFPLISDLLARLAVLPAASAEVERVFSSMKRIKPAQWNRLNTNTLDHLIRISMEGPKVNRMGSISSTSAVGILGKQEAGDIRQLFLVLSLTHH